MLSSVFLGCQGYRRAGGDRGSDFCDDCRRSRGSMEDVK